MKKSQVIGNVVTFGVLSLFSAVAFSAGLSSATQEVNEIKTWLYTVLGVLAGIYLMVNVGMAFAEKKDWGDVLAAIGKVAAAGGILIAGDWAWSIWGS